MLTKFGTRWRDFSNSTLRAPYPKIRAPALIKLEVVMDPRVGPEVIPHDKYFLTANQLALSIP